MQVLNANTALLRSGVSVVADARATNGWFVPHADRDIERMYKACYSGKAIFLPGEI